MAEEVNIADESVDRISSLPDAILRHILSFLPTKFAVGTSILSTRWRYLFPVSNNLDFDKSLVFSPSQRGEASPNGHFMEFVDWCIMLMNEKRIEKFRLKCRHFVDNARVNSWIYALPMCNVQELDLCIPVREYPMMEHPRVFTCSTLVVLKLGKGFSLKVPASVHLPCLKTLLLDSITFLDEVSIQRLFSGCPVLEDLSIVSCSMGRIRSLKLCSPYLKRLILDKIISEFSKFKLVLDVPSLVYLKYTVGKREKYTVKNLHSLSEAHISFKEPCSDDAPTSLPEIFKEISHVQSLSFSGYFEKGSMMYKDEDECADVPCCLKSKLKAIECATFWHLGMFLQKDVQSIEYFLKNGDLLEKMLIHVVCQKSYHEEIFDNLNKVVAKLPLRLKPCDVYVFSKPLI